MTAMRVVDVDAADTHELRRRVLRDGTTSNVVVFDGDDVADTFHLGVLDDGKLIGVSTWLRRAYPDRPAVVGVQLRGMATDPDRRHEGVASAMLAAGLERAAAGGAGVVWARARDTALGFYERHGFVAVGLGYVDLTTGLPHHDIVIDLER